jgi:predicted DNA-binding protein
MSSELKPFLVRLTPESVELLDKAAKQLKRHKAVIINQLINQYLSDSLNDINERLNKLSA